MLGPIGARARPHPWWTPLRLLLAAAVLTGLVTVAAQAPCASGSDPRWFADPPTGAVTLCASDLPRQYLRTGLAEGRLPLADGVDRYESSGLSAPLAVVAWGTAGLTRVLTGADDVDARDDRPLDALAASPELQREALVYTGLSAVLLLLATWTVVVLVGRRLLSEAPPGTGLPARAWWLAVPPVLVVAGLSGWGLLPLVVVVGGFVAWRTGWAMLGGFLLGLAVVSAGWTVVALVAVAALALRRPDPDTNAALAAAVGTWISLSVVLFVLTAGASNTAVVDDLVGSPDVGTSWWVLGSLGLPLDGGAVGTVTALVWLVTLVGVVAIGAVPRWDVDPAALVVLALVALLVVGVRLDPLQSLWLLPFVVLAHRGQRAALEIGLWQAAELFAVLTLAWDAAGVTDAVDGSNPLAGVGVLVRVAAEVLIAWRVLTLGRHMSVAAGWASRNVASAGDQDSSSSPSRT